MLYDRSNFVIGQMCPVTGQISGSYKAGYLTGHDRSIIRTYLHENERLTGHRLQQPQPVRMITMVLIGSG